MNDPVDVVRRGYDELSRRYRYDDGAAGPKYGAWLAELIGSLAAGARVLDVGCGNGIPVARDLVAAGFDVTGVDLSEVQIERARTLVPAAQFIRADVSTVEFPAASFDAVIALYSIIHVPLDDQSALLQRMADWTVDGGTGLVVAGAESWTGTEENWLGGNATMWWSQADAATYRHWLGEAGWTITEEAFVPEGDGGHQLFWLSKGSTTRAGGGDGHSPPAS